MMTQNLELQILLLLEKQPGQTAQKIAESIDVDKAAEALGLRLVFE